MHVLYEKYSTQGSIKTNQYSALPLALLFLDTRPGIGSFIQCWEQCFNIQLATQFTVYKTDTVDLENFGIKKLHKAHTSTKLKHKRFFTMMILLLNNQYMHLPFKAHSNPCTPNVCDNNVYEAQMCTSFYQQLVLIQCKCTGQQHLGSTSKDELPEPRGSLVNDMLSVLQSKPIKMFNKTTAIHNTCQTKHQMLSNFRIFKFRMLFNFVYQIIYKIKSLRNVTFITMKVSRSMVIGLVINVANQSSYDLATKQLYIYLGSINIKYFGHQG